MVSCYTMRSLPNSLMKHAIGSLCIALLLSACSTTKIGVEEGIGTYEVTTAMPTKEGFKSPEHGQETWFAMTAMTGVDGVNANGVAEGHLFEDGTFSHSVQLNIKFPDNDYFYEGWLVNPDTGKFISTGHLNSLFGDVRHSLQYTSVEDMREYSKVIITLEPDDGDPAPAAHVAEGLLQVRER